MTQQGIIYAFILDGKGSGRRIGWDEIKKWTPGQGILWTHFDYSADDTRHWILYESGLGDISAEAILTEETRPRTTFIQEGALIALRGVNLNPGSTPEDMVSVRLWVDQNKIISSRKRTLLSIMDIADSLKKNTGPKTAGEFIVDLADRLTARMQGTIEDIEDRLAQLEEEVMEGETHELRNALSGIRREAIMLRRYLAPQREALIKLYSERVPWLTQNDHIHLREVTDSLIRYLEDLDSVRDRAAVTQEELINRLSEQLNNRMYVLSLVAAVFLPLGFLTGLLGINVGGIPGANYSGAFLIFICILLLVVGVELIIFKKKQWL